MKRMSSEELNETEQAELKRVQRNVISGNGGDGVSVGDGVDVLNNYIGTNKDGAGDVGNGEVGVDVSGADAVVGKPGAGNIEFPGEFGAKIFEVRGSHVSQGQKIDRTGRFWIPYQPDLIEHHLHLNRYFANCFKIRRAGVDIKDHPIGILWLRRV